MSTTYTKSLLTRAVGALFFLSLASTGFGQTWNWNAASGNWNVGANWTPATVPTSSTTTNLGFFNGTSSNNNIAGTFVLNQININRGSSNFAITGNAIQFAGTTPQLNVTFGASGQTYTISNNLNLAAATTFNINRSGTSGPQPTLTLSGVISGANSLTIATPLVTVSNVGVILGNAANSFSGGLIIMKDVTVNPGAAVTIGAAGNSYLGSGTVTINNQTSGNNYGSLIVQSSAATALTYSRNTTVGVGNGTSVDTELTLVGGTGLTTAANYTFTNPNASSASADLTMSTATGTISANGATFTAGGSVAVTANINFNSAITTGAAVTAATGSVAASVLNFNYGTIASAAGALGWNNATGNTLNFGTVSGSGILNLTLTNGALAMFNATATAMGTLASIQVDGVSGGSLTANSSATNIARLGFAAANYTLPTAGGLHFSSGATQVSSVATGLTATTLTGNITVDPFGATVAFQGRGGTAAVGAFNIGATTPNTNTFVISTNGTAVFDLAFRNDTNTFVGQMNLYSTTTINTGAQMIFRGTQNVGGTTYNAINVRGDIIGTGNSSLDSTLLIENTVGSVTVSAALSTVARQIAFSNTITLFVQGGNKGGLRVEGSSTNVNGLLTDTILSTRVLSVGTPSTDQGTLTIAYNDNATRTFTNASGPTAASWIKLGFDSAGGSTPTYTLSSTGGNLGNWNGLVVAGGTVALGASGLTFNGASGAAPLIMAGGTFSIGANNVTFTGIGDLRSGTINGTTGTITFNGNATKSGSGVVNLNGNINILGSTGLTISGGILNQQASNLINNTARMVLAGGTWATSGFSETLNTLTLTANSDIDLGAGASIINFANSSAVSWTSGASLYIDNWSGNAGGGGTDQVYFGTTSAGLTAGQLNQIFFYNPAGFAGGIYSAQILSTGEIVPLARVVPEPSTVLMGVGLAGAAIAFELRRRRRKNAEKLDSELSKE